MQTNTPVRNHHIILAFFAGFLAIWTEGRAIKHDALFFNWMNNVPLGLLLIALVIYIVLNIREYKRHQNGKALLPALICLVSALIVVGQIKARQYLDASYTVFKAHTNQIGSDGGLYMDFKKNGHLKAEKQDHWEVTYYWGHYSQQGDTLLLDIPFDFNISRQAVTTDTSLHFVDEPYSFELYKSPSP